MECSLCGNLLVTAMQELLEASSMVSLFGGGAQLPKGPALGFVPRVVGRHPVGILSSFHTQNRPLPFPEHPRQGDLNVDGGEGAPPVLSL